MSHQYKFWLPVGGSFLVLIAFGVALSAGGACTNASKAFGDEIAKSANCIEFWFNRYQSLIGNILTAAVAGVTLFWISRQLEVSHRENAISAASALRVRATELEQEIDVLGLIEVQVMTLIWTATRDALPMSERISTLHKLGSEVFALKTELDRFARANRDDSLTHLRGKLRQKLVFSNFTVNEETPAALETYSDRLHLLYGANRDLSAALGAETVSVYRAIRELERRATRDR